MQVYQAKGYKVDGNLKGVLVVFVEFAGFLGAMNNGVLLKQYLCLIKG